MVRTIAYSTRLLIAMIAKNALIVEGISTGEIVIWIMCSLIVQAEAKVVPVCHECNWSKGDKGFVSWLKWLHDNDKAKYQRIADHHFEKAHRPMADISRITMKVSEVDWENYSWWARLKGRWQSR